MRRKQRGPAGWFGGRRGLRRLKYRYVPARRQHDANRIIAAFVLEVLLEFLAQRVRLAPNHGVFAGRIVFSSSEDLMRNQVLVQLCGFAVQRCFADEPKEMRETLRT